MGIPIATNRLILRSLSLSDAKAVSHNSQGLSIRHFLSDMVFETEEDARGWIEWFNNKKFDISIPSIALAVEEKETGICIGLIGVAPKKELNEEIEILFLIADEYQNKGYATEAAKAIIWWAFEMTDLEALSAIIKPDNAASRQVIENVGFIYGDSRKLPYDGKEQLFDYFRLYHTDDIPSPVWDIKELYLPEDAAVIIYYMSERKAAAILEVMDVNLAARITEILLAAG